MTLNALKRVIAPIQRKIFLMLGRAIVKLVDNTTKTQGLQLRMLANETINDAERFQEYGFEAFPFTNTQAFVGCLNGNRDIPIVLCVHDRENRPLYLIEGEVVVYTDEDSSSPNHRIHFKRDRITNIKCDKLDIDALTEITEDTKTKTVNVTTFIINGNISSSDGGGGSANFVTDEMGLGALWSACRQLVDDRMVALFNGHTHPGDSGGTTGTPNQTMSAGSHCTTKARGV
ncbi:MAG: phage baseplate assembly protein V [Candidatus Scalindua sp.]